ncbi:MAG: tail fiber protein [Pseudomonadota bacterium]
MKLKLALLAATIFGAVSAAPTVTAAQEPFIGELRLFANNFCPRSWTQAQGQILSISQHTALFALLGTTFGGDGRTTFAVPDLSGRAPIGLGTGPGLSTYAWGQEIGLSETIMRLQQMPAHSHSLVASDDPVDTHDGIDDFFGSFGSFPAYSTNTTAGQMASSVVGSTGSGLPFNIQQPQIVMNWCIALEGLFPSRS